MNASISLSDYSIENIALGCLNEIGGRRVVLTIKNLNFGSRYMAKSLRYVIRGIL